MPDLDLNGPRDVAFCRFEESWVERPAIELFAEIAARRPDAVACEDGDDGFTFAAMWKAACWLARLIDTAIPSGGAVGVLLPNQASYPAAVLACLGASRSCILIDRNYPQERVAAVVRDAGLSAVVMSRADIASGYLLPAGVRPFAIEDAFAAAEVPPAMPATPASADSPSFVVYTSGSTGQPKGIVLSQRAVLHRAAELVNAVHLHAADKVLSLASPGTIGGLQQIFEVMLCGAALVKLDLQRIGLGQVLRAVAERRITMMFSTPAVWRSVMQLEGAREALASLRCIQTSGDVLLRVDHELMRKVLPSNCAILSVYGATEAPALLQWFVTEPPHDEARVPVGYPLPDIDFAVIDEHGQPVADGGEGELVVRSAFMSLGLWRDGDVAAGPFELDSSRPHLKTYRTGDLVRRRSDGLFVMLGRRDRQIKIRGNRVELAEIETALRRDPSVADAAVVARMVDDEPRVLAFVVPRGSETAGFPTEIRNSLARTLPPYMRPRAVHVMDSLPLLPGRKVDEAALLARANVDGEVDVPVPTPTVGPQARAMVNRAWRTAVGRAPRSGQSFEDAGGDSLAFLQMIFHLERLAGRALPLERFHARLDGEGIARALESFLEEKPRELAADEAAVFFFPPGGGTDGLLAGFCRAIAERLSLRLLRYPGAGVLARADTRFETIARLAVEQITREKPHGPLVLAGYSAGGDVAYATMTQLIAEGREVVLLGVLDTDVSGVIYPPEPVLRRRPLDQLVRLWRAFRRGYWKTLAAAILSDDLFTRRGIRGALRALLALDPPLPESWRMTLSTVILLRLFHRLHTDWRKRLRPVRFDVPVVLFRSDEPRPAEVPQDMGWSNRSSRVDVVHVAGDHWRMFEAPDVDRMLAEHVFAALNARRSL